MFRFVFVLAVIWPSGLAVAEDLAPEVVDRSTLTGKVMCGYQGWFNCDGDGADLGWTHWSKNRRTPPSPGNVVVDLWPDLTEYDSDERYATEFNRADGSVAEVFSSTNRKTVLRHFQWMQQYGIDGAFVQRFAAGVKRVASREHKDRVLQNARDGANQYGRAFAVMYDLSGLKSDDTKIVQEDWQAIEKQIAITSDKAYLHHDGKPVVAIWGIGFDDDRDYTLDDCTTMIRWFKQRGCTVMLGVPTGWRTLDRDAIDDPDLLATIQLADIVSPWTIGRYRTPKEAERHGKRVWQPDQQWCTSHDQAYFPVVFPGFSWHNLKGAKLDAIPRLKGEFLWSQILSAKQAGAEMIYVAMFDEVDEGTAIFKCTNDVPIGDAVSFLDYEDLPSDHYLKLVGKAGKLLRGELSDSEHAEK